MPKVDATRVLAVNAGTTSLKLSVVSAGERLAETTIEHWAGQDLSGLETFLRGAHGVDAVARRVVHAVTRLGDSVRLDGDLLDRLDSLSALSPRHDPRAVRFIRRVCEVVDLSTVLCFDTAFYRTIPPEAAIFALRAPWSEEGERGNGAAQGLSHAHVVRRTAELVGRPADRVSPVSCHLGSSSSLAAVRHGRCVDTTFGFTLQEGLSAVTRADTQPAGITGYSGDMREILDGKRRGDSTCEQALAIYMHRLCREAGAMVAAAGPLDALAFTGGVGEGSVEVRAHLSGALAHLGVQFDADRNAGVTEGVISPEAAGVSTLIVRAGEDLEMAREVDHLLG
ncbi:MAG: ackA [Marmoricola sp.]|nr:ackA [Marmoricola sp.]